MVRYHLPQTSNFRQIAVFGRMNPHKGEELLKSAARDAYVKQLPIQYILFGKIEVEPELTGDRLVCVGEYDQTSLSRLLDETDCKIGLLPSIWPETFSYVLSEIIVQGLYPVVLNYGAPPERLEKLGFGLVLPRTILGNELNLRLLKLSSSTMPEGLALETSPAGVESWPVYKEVI